MIASISRGRKHLIDEIRVCLLFHKSNHESCSTYQSISITTQVLSNYLMFKSVGVCLVNTHKPKVNINHFIMNKIQSQDLLATPVKPLTSHYYLSCPDNASWQSVTMIYWKIKEKRFVVIDKAQFNPSLPICSYFSISKENQRWVDIKEKYLI